MSGLKQIWSGVLLGLTAATLAHAQTTAFVHATVHTASGR
jgi:hypothetical protein